MRRSARHGHVRRQPLRASLRWRSSSGGWWARLPPPVEDADETMTTEASPSFSLVIPTRDRHRELDACLRAVAELEVQPAEVIVVDNSTGDLLTQEVAD